MVELVDSSDLGSDVERRAGSSPAIRTTKNRVQNIVYYGGEVLMTYKQIEASREVRLWITQVVIPAFGVAMMIPEAREAVVAKAKDVKNKLENKLRK